MMMRRVLRSTAVIAVVAFAAGGAACRAVATGPSHYAPFSQTDLVVGTGEAVKRGDVVLVDYTGWLYDASRPDQKGAVFDTSRGRGPFSFTLGTGQVIDGWDEGLVGMQQGGIRRLVIPPSKAYGNRRAGAIPPYGTLIFEIELLGVNASAVL